MLLFLIALTSTNGIKAADTVLMTGIGVTTASPHVDAISAGVNITASSAQTLENGQTITFTGSSRAATITASVRVLEFGTDDTAGLSQTIKLGTVEEISNQYRKHMVIISNYTLTTPPVNLEQSFVMFSKDNKANLTSLTGYYAKARFENNSKEKAELFAVSSEIVVSSK